MLTDGKVTPERLKLAVTNAMIEANRELSGWRQSQIAAGFASPDAVPAEYTNDDRKVILRYRDTTDSGESYNICELI